jgi:hypothetical protein
MSPFEKYGIEHLSPSSCNTFSSSPAAFILQKCMKKTNTVGAAAHRGTSAETGIAYGLLNPDASVEECITKAREHFSELTALRFDSNTDKERDALAAFVKNGLKELRPYGIPTSLQGHVSHEVEGLDVPLIGYYDFEWADKKVLIDLKTTHRLPSKISLPHARQVSLYKATRGVDLSARITYTTPAKVATYELENYREHLDALERICLTIQKFLSISEDPLELASYVVPDVDSFYFNDPATRQEVFEVWGV